MMPINTKSSLFNVAKIVNHISHSHDILNGNIFNNLMNVKNIHDIVKRKL